MVDSTTLPDADARSLLIVEDNDRFAETLGSELRRPRLRGPPRPPTSPRVDAIHEPRRPVRGRRSPARCGLRARRDPEDPHPLVPRRGIVVLTGYGSIATAVKATKLGAVGYLMKPTDVDQVERALNEVEDDEDSELPIPDEFQSLYRHEREYIEYVLAECEGNISQAARRLGLHRQSLQRKLRKYTPQ